MKSRFLSVALVAFVLSCSPKVVVQPTTPAAPATPTVAEEPKATASDSMYVGAPNLPSPENVAKGKELYENNCGNCHKLFSPKERTAQQWQPILVRMQKKARLTDEDMVFINAYVMTNM